MPSRKQVEDRTRKVAKRVIRKAEKAGSRALDALGETPEYVSLRRTDRALRSEMDEHIQAIGKRVFALHKRARGESPFARFNTIMKDLDALTQVEEEYRSNKIQLNRLKERVRGKGARGGS